MIAIGPFTYLRVGCVRVLECDWSPWRIVAVGRMISVQRFR